MIEERPWAATSNALRACAHPLGIDRHAVAMLLIFFPLQDLKPDNVLLSNLDGPRPVVKLSVSTHERPTARRCAQQSNGFAAARAVLTDANATCSA